MTAPLQLLLPPQGPYQTEGIRFALQKRYSINGDQMGLGKTMQALGAVAAAQAQRILVVCPAVLVFNWRAEIQKFLGESALPRFKVLSYDSIHHLRHLDEFDFVIADECFVAGTLVDTPGGPRAIETLRPGDEVLSAAGVDRIVEVRETETEETIKVNGIECTPNHPFLTTGGWLQAKCLTRGDFLVETSEAMRLVQGGFPSGRFEAAVLRDLLLSEMAVESARDQSKGLHERGGGEVFGEETRPQEPHCGIVASSQQLHAQRGDPAEGLRNIEENRAPTEGPRRERERPDAPREIDFWLARRGVGAGVCSGTRNPDGSAAPLQDRPGSPDSKDSDRGGRAVAQLPEGAGGGSLETDRFGKVRVESLEVQERRSRVTYNLQVERHPSFSVNGVLVHNCHYVKNLEAKRTEKLHELLEKRQPPHYLALSGTPIKNSVPEIYSLLKLCWYGGRYPEFDKWSRSIYGFLQKFTTKKTIYIGSKAITKYDGVRNVEELKALIRPVYIRRKTEEVLTLPKQNFQEILLSQSDNFDATLRGAWDAYEGGGNKAVFSSAKAVSALAKVPHTVAFAEDLLTNTDRVVVFTDHVQAATEIHKKLGGGLVTGGVPADERAALIRSFEAGEIPALTATIGAMSVGVNLTSCSRMVFNDLPWVPADLAQAEARIHRIGQKHPCFYYYMLASRQDQVIYRTLAAKKKLIAEVGV